MPTPDPVGNVTWPIVRKKNVLVAENRPCEDLKKLLIG